MNLRRLSTFLSFITAAVFLTGCATSVVYQVASESAERPLTFKLLDQRDENQKRSELMGGLLLTDCLYGLYRIGDDQIAPDRIKLLGQSLQAALGDKLTGSSLVVNKYEVFSNYRSALSGITASNNTNDPATLNTGTYGLNPNNPSSWMVTPLVTSVISAFTCEDKIFREKNPNNLPSVIVNIELVFGQSRITGNVVQIEPVGKDATIRGDFSRARMTNAITETTRKVTEEIARLLSK